MHFHWTYDIEFLDDVIAVRNDCDQKYSILEENIAETKSNLSNDTQVSLTSGPKFRGAEHSWTHCH